MHTIYTLKLLMLKKMSKRPRYENTSWPKKVNFTGWLNYHDTIVCVHAVPHTFNKI